MRWAVLLCIGLTTQALADATISSPPKPPPAKSVRSPEYEVYNVVLSAIADRRQASTLIVERVALGAMMPGGFHFDEGDAGHDFSGREPTAAELEAKRFSERETFADYARQIDAPLDPRRLRGGALKFV